MNQPELMDGESHRGGMMHPVLLGVVAIVGCTLLHLTGSFFLILDAQNPANRTLARVMIGVAQLLLMLAPTVMLARYAVGPVEQSLRLRPGPPFSYLAMGIAMVSLWPLLQTVLIAQELYLIPPDILASLKSAQENTESTYRLLLASDTPTGLLISIAIGALIPALSEEALYRGLGQGLFRQALRPAGAILLSGLLFAGLHFQPLAFLPLLGLGCFLGFVTERTGSIIPAITGHAMFNAVTIMGLSAVGEMPPELQKPPAITTELFLQSLPGAAVAMVILVLVILWFRKMQPAEPNAPV
ncbi:MAG: CPBP family intramembrane metalloprotease [Chlorobi bacterium]|nr:CPBP family intramembrane metalloprotease [Chlorobiota bacterium]